MKLLLILALFATIPFAIGQTEPNKDQEAESASRRLLQKKRERTMIPAPTTTTTREEEVKEEQINDDADPELDAVDDDLTQDEGLNDD